MASLFAKELKPSINPSICHGPFLGNASKAHHSSSAISHLPRLLKLILNSKHKAYVPFSLFICSFCVIPKEIQRPLTSSVRSRNSVLAHTTQLFGNYMSDHPADSWKMLTEAQWLLCVIVQTPYSSNQFG